MGTIYKWMIFFMTPFTKVVTAGEFFVVSGVKLRMERN